jgi:two-component system, NarL family, sensor kinase
MPITRAEVLTIVVLMTIFILVMVTFIIIILFFLQKKQKGFANELFEVKANYEHELFKAQLEIQEQTFQEIAREIHDNVGQMLSLAKLGLGTLDLAKQDESRSSILEISDILEKSLGDLRHMSRSMNSEVIKNGGLIKSIESQVGYIQRGGRYNIHFSVNGERVKMEVTKEIILFRITQEAVNNIIRHAQASEICISLCYSKEMLIMQIKDNGKGFNLNEKNSGSNNINGLYNMQHRANLIDSEFVLESQIGIGTTVTVNTPY